MTRLALAAAFLFACNGGPAEGDADTTSQADADADSDADTDTDTEAEPIGPGPYAIVYAVNEPYTGTIDMRPSVDATFDASGAMTGAIISANFDVDIGSATAEGYGSTATLAWGAWADGTLGGGYYSATIALGSDEALHYLVATLGAPPTGAATFATHLGATDPTFDENAGAPGTLDAASVDADFDTGRFTATADLTVDGNALTLTANALLVVGNPAFLASGGLTTGAACSGACQTVVWGLVGDGERIGFGYDVTLRDGRDVRGVVALGK